jgi:crotonobetainyl-CoA:carnitine CoA-transferase CaiB-like acyl-CoA transferase
VGPERPLAGIAIAELGGEIATRYCARLFARMGASVWRASDPDDGLDPLFAAWLDQGKQIVADDAAALAALERADTRRRLAIAGQTRDRLARAEALIGERDVPLLKLSWFDPRGAYADWRANDALIQAMTGIAFGFGPPEGPPTLPQGHAPQILAGAVAFVAAMGALVSDRRPRRIESSVFEAALCFAETAAISTAALGFEVRRLGVNRLSPTCPCNIYPTTDGYIGVTALTNAQWVSLARLIGREDLATDPRLHTSLMRLEVGDAIDAALAPAMALKPTAYWVEHGIARRIPLTPSDPPGALPHMPHWRDRGAFEAIDGAAQGPTLPFRFTFHGARKATPPGGPAGPLEGVRVADFSMGWAGPLAARHLADLGADVLKIESAGRRDWWRGWDAYPDVQPPPYELPNNFMCVNRNKRGLDLDLTSAGGRAAAEAIVRVSDIVIENQGPGVMDKLGLGLTGLRRLRPDVVAVTMPPFGRDGPLAGLRAYGSTVEQASGMPFVNGQAAWPPSHQHVAYGDPVAGVYAAAAALVGLYARGHLGGGDVEVSQVECLFQLGADAIIAETALGRRRPRTGSRRTTMAPCCVVQGLGGQEDWLAIAVDSDDAWLALADAMGRSDLAADPELRTLAGRKAREDEIEAAIAAWAANEWPRGAAEALQAAGVPASAVLAAHDLFPDPHLQDCGFWAYQHRAYIGDHFTPQPPYRYDGERPAVVRAAPTLGQHTEEVLAELRLAREAQA